MRRTDRVAGALALALVLGACGSDSSSTKASCNFPQDGACIDYVGSLSSDQLSTLQNTACTPNSGQWSTSACATSGRVGSCTIQSSNGLTQVVRVYPASGYGAAQAEPLCTGGQLFGGGVAGTWTNG